MNRTEPGWELYRSFLAVVQEGSLSAAARSLGLTQPTLGRHIDELEASLSVGLFVRSRTGLAPTQAAHDLLPHARAMASAAQALIRAASSEATDEGGTVRLTASDVVGTEILPSFLSAFHEAHPRIAIELVLSNRTEDLLQREADIAIRMVRPTQTALIARKVGDVGLCLHASPRYLNRRGRPDSLDELGAHSLIGFDRQTLSAKSIKAPDFFLQREHFSFRSDNDLAQLAALRAGLGIGVCQQEVAAKFPALDPVLPESLHFSLPVWLVMHEDMKASTRVRMLYDHLAESFVRYLSGKPQKHDLPA